MEPHITLYLFNHMTPRMEVAELNQKAEFQSKTIIQMQKTCKELLSIVDLLTDKANRLVNK